MSRLPDRLTLEQAVTHCPFSIPCGLVLSRTLVLDCLQPLPTREFRGGADGILCPAALIRTGCAHYLRETLGIYRIHGNNEFARIVDGQYVPRFNPHVRAPKTQRFLERWRDQQDNTPEQRMLALHDLRGHEHLVRRLSASHRLEAPRVAVAVLGETDDPACQAPVSASGQSHDPVTVCCAPADGATELMRLASAWAASSAQYLVFLRAGDTLDRSFVERHLFVRQHGALVSASCRRYPAGRRRRCAGPCRRVPQQRRVETATAEGAAAGHRPAPPGRRADGRLHAAAQPAAGPIFLAHAPVAAPTLQAAGFWLLMQSAHHTGSVLRVRENLSSCRLRDGAAASYGYLSVASGADGSLIQPPIAEAVDGFNRFYQQEQALLHQWLPEAWHRRFAEWLAAQQHPEAASPANTAR